MNAKQQKFYQNLFDFAKTDFIQNPAEALQFLDSCLDYDFQTAVDLWEYILLSADKALTKNPNLALTLGDMILELFNLRSETKTVKLVNDSAIVRKVIYSVSPSAATDTNFKIVMDQIMSTKPESAEEILRCLAKNTEKQFGTSLRAIMEQVTVEIMKKAAATGKKPEISKKLSAFLSSHIAKVKGPDKALLEQRLKELQ